MALPLPFPPSPAGAGAVECLDTWSGGKLNWPSGLA